MKRCLGVFLALVLLLTGLTAVASASIYVDWEADGAYLADASTGKRIEFTGWREDTYEWDPDWKCWFYSEGKGKLTEGWKQIGGQWYYFWPEMCASSWYDEAKNTVYLFGKDGAWTGVSTSGDGWLNMNNKWYYVEKYTEQYEEGSYTWKYFYSNGNYEINGKVYFFKDGVMQSNGWNSSEYTWDGKIYTDWYYANPNGELATGWKQIDGKWYYFSDWGWMYSDGLYTINKNLYAFEASGAMKANQWHSETWTWDDGHKEVQWLYMGADGAAKTGWYKVGNDWYYADEWGWMYADCWIEDGGAQYYLAESGAMAIGWKQLGGDWFYFKGSGALAEKEWVLDGGNWYYMDEDGVMLAGGTYIIDGKEYKFAASGAWIP